MAKINTLNYQTVAAWNGSQDLFVVEQSDGTKVATPAMVKQFIEAGDFEATGEVKDGHGNILADMAKSADVATLAEQLGNFKCFANSLAINDNAVKQLLTDADAASITMAIINPTISSDGTPFAGKAYFVISVKYDATRGTQYAIQIIGGTGKKQRLFNNTWGAWS